MTTRLVRGTTLSGRLTAHPPITAGQYFKDDKGEWIQVESVAWVQHNSTDWSLYIVGPVVDEPEAFGWIQ